ncbi:DUF6262 family protein [Saccharopolyspora shandongensis]|uniref:DUF6262 family protein n=1 Tax=Saccharopolyspora shandongensis TaxID=418495 RepID=UPI0034242A2E
MRGNPDNLRQAAARKSAAAQARAEQGLREMIRNGLPITFRGLAQTAAVSLDFLYRHNEIRQRIEHLRAQQQTRPPSPPTVVDPDQPSSVIRTLTTQLAELKRRHRVEISELKDALATAHGELLILRRQAGLRNARARPSTTPTEPVLGIEVALNTVFEQQSGQPVAEVKAALQKACDDHCSPLDEETLTEFAELIAAGEYIDITTSSSEPAGPENPSF